MGGNSQEKGAGSVKKSGWEKSLVVSGRVRTQWKNRRKEELEARKPPGLGVTGLEDSIYQDENIVD